MTSVITEQVHASEANVLTMTLPAVRNPPSAQAGRRNKVRLDPLRALEPTRKKLTSVEAQRIVSVLEDAKRKIEVMTLLPYVLNNIDKYRSVIGDELSLLLEQHKAEYQALQEMEKKIADSNKGAEHSSRDGDQQAAGRATPAPLAQQTLSPSRPASGKITAPSPLPSQSRALSAKSVSAESGRGAEPASPALDGVSAMKQQLTTSFKNILRAFSGNLSAAKIILDEPTSSRSREANYLINNLNELKDILMERLLMTPVEENEKMHYLAQVSAQERNNVLVIEKLSAELAVANEEKDAEIRKKNDVIRKLQSELHVLEKQTEEEIRRMKTDADKQEAADRKNSDGKKQKLTAEINQLRAQLQNLITEHREEEQNLRRKKWKIETEVENWIQKYDVDMGDRQDEFEEIDSVYTEEKKQLHELEERFKTLESEYKQIMTERTAAREKRQAAERELELMTKAATTIQAFWRSFKVRKALKAKNKKGGKKGKKK